MPNNRAEVLTKVAINAANAVFSETSVSKAETRTHLQEIRDEIDIMIDSLGE